MLSSTTARAVLGATMAALAIAPAAALAAAPAERYHEHYSDSFSDQICGIGVDVQVVGTDNFMVYADGSATGTGAFRATIVNPLNGTSVVLSAAGQTSLPNPVVDEAAGTITFQPTLKGLPGKIQTAHGSVLLRDAGLITLSETVDLQTGELLAAATIVNNGPHPEADSDFTRSCEVLVQALG